MNYNEACEILKVNQSDSIEEIRKNYLELISKYHPDVNQTKESTEMTQRINDAYKFIKKNYTSKYKKTAYRDKKDEELSYVEFSNKYLHNKIVQNAIDNYNTDMLTLYSQYKHYILLCKNNKSPNIQFLEWVSELDLLNTYSKIILKERLLTIIKGYLESIDYNIISLRQYVITLIYIKIKKQVGINLNLYQVNKYLEEYMKNEDDNKISFIEWLKTETNRTLKKCK